MDSINVAIIKYNMTSRVIIKRLLKCSDEVIDVYFGLFNLYVIEVHRFYEHLSSIVEL